MSSDRCGAAESACRWNTGTAGPDGRLLEGQKRQSDLVKGTISPYNKPVRTYPHSIQPLTSTSLLEKHFADRTFLETERITLADITLAAEVQHASTTTVDATLRVKLPNVLRHFENIVNQPNLTSIFGSTAFPKAEKKPKKEEVDDDDDDKQYEEATREKNPGPLDLLPKSTLNLEDWKRAYSNKDTRGADGLLEWLHQNFDKECYSLWRVDFKYNEELTQTFMSSNQIGGFFNRLEASRKYLFGSVGALGTANNSIIAGALIARGQEIRPVVEAFFEAALAWDLEVGDKKWVDGEELICPPLDAICI
ncbi:hypothetical protein BC826DRAFT_1093883 [Russula brevipes]|nr:hypothetical protein BC826DRAFT_1093883 [Russula brevipes]